MQRKIKRRLKAANRARQRRAEANGSRPSEVEQVALELDDLMAGGPLEWVGRPVTEERAERLRPTSGPLRSFRVVEVRPGEGLVVEPLGGEGGWPERFFVREIEASLVLAPGDLFACQAEAPEDVWIWPFWEGCPHCQERIAERSRVP